MVVDGGGWWWMVVMVVMVVMVGMVGMVVIVVVTVCFNRSPPLADHFWVESFANPNWQGRDWTAASLAAEYAETKAWAVHMLTSYSGTGKVFMAGNWEGDWVLLGASGCKRTATSTSLWAVFPVSQVHPTPHVPYSTRYLMPVLLGCIWCWCCNQIGTAVPGGKGYNFTCDPTPAVINRMVQWGKTRQRAIDDARTEAAAAGAANVTLLYYIEMNLGPESLPPGSAGCASTNAKEACTSKPGITNSVLKEVNPDLVSYSSYTATNAYASAGDTSAVDALLVATLDHVQAQLSDKPTLGSHPLGFAKRVFIGEFGATPKMIPNTTFAGRYLARVYSAAIGWGVPMALYWELYSNNSTIPLVPAPGGGGEAMSRAVYLRLQAYFTAARRECGGLNSTQMQRWAAQYWKRQL